MALSKAGTRRSVSVTDVKVFKIVDLLVDEDNFRLEPNADQPSAIKAMLRRQGKKLVVLAEDVLDNELSVGEFVWVAPDPRPEFAGKYVVCEGNRRITALKLLAQPALADGTAWSKQFRELGARFRQSRITHVRGVLYPSVNAARPDVYRRHTNDQDGKGLEAWDPFAQDRANKAQGSRRTLSMIVMEHLTRSTIDAFAESLGLLERTTNADRLLGTFSKELAAGYGIKLRATSPYTLSLGTDPDLSGQLLRAILEAANVPVDAIKSEGQRSSLLRKVIAEIEAAGGDETRGKDDAKEGTSKDSSDETGGRDADAKPAGETKSDETEAASKRKGATTRPDPLERLTLAPGDRESSLHVKGARLTGLYKECKSLIVADQPNAAAVLLRVFLELSCEAYLEKEGVRTPGAKADWKDFGITLEHKVRKVLDKLDHDRKAVDLLDAHTGLSEDAGFSHSIRSLHRAMHDRNQVLDARQIKLNWQRWHPLFIRIHDAIRTK